VKQSQCVVAELHIPDPEQSPGHDVVVAAPTDNGPKLPLLDNIGKSTPSRKIAAHA
jgi:hypothetical protein